MRAIHTRKMILPGILALAALILAAGTAPAAAPAPADGGIRFSLEAPDAGAVFLAGDFNGWDASGLPLAKGDDGVWTVVVELAAGDHEYKFVVDGDWREDPANPRKVTDPFGGSNSVVTVQADGTVGGAAAGAPAAATPPPAATADGEVALGPPVGTTDGVLFTHRAPGAGSVHLAGSFNGWSATDWPLTDVGGGLWMIVKKLDAGSHQYKFVVDGNWVTDPENGSTQDDGYGGANSLVTVDAAGNVTAAPAAAGAGAGDSRRSSDLNAKLYLGGRYLTRFEAVKNGLVPYGPDEVAKDTRWRLPRPTQSVDLNFEAEVTSEVTSFIRLRLDSDQNIIQNNVVGFLDEANIRVNPDNFDLLAYWNQEVFTGKDLLQSGGNIDLPGTIMHDRIDYGKGSAGVLFDAVPWGFDFQAFFANVHNADYYNDPELYDNTGEDRLSARLARRFGGLEIGLPFYAERSLVWLDFNSVPTTTIPSLDEHRTGTGDASTWYENDTSVVNVGADLRYDLGEDFMVGGQFMYVDYLQRLVTGNAAGEDGGNGSLDLPYLERDRRKILGQVDWSPGEGTKLSVKQIFADMDGANPDQRLITYLFENQETANKQILFEIGNAPAQVKQDSTDVTFSWNGENKDLELWLRRTRLDMDFAPVDRTVPEDSTVTSRIEDTWNLAARFGMGRSAAFLGRGELEAGYSSTDMGVAGRKVNSLEMILRWDRDLTRNTGLIADLRYILYDVEGRDETGADVARSPGYFNPFAGFRYTPIDDLDLVLAYGVDPLDYSIDYQGRNLGRWWFRQNYLFAFPDDDLLDAEDYLSKIHVITLRAHLLF